jgi:hypothetical protein
MKSITRGNLIEARLSFLVHLLTGAVFALAGCGGGGPDGDQIETLTINSPSNTGSYTTDQAFITLTGTSFRPAFVDGPMGPFQQCGLTDRYGVTAVNEVAGTKLPPVVGEAIWIGTGPNCNGLDVYVRFIDLPLRLGRNVVTITAREANRVGMAAIVIERTVDTTPPSALSVWPSDGSTGVPVTTTVSAEFSEPIDPTSVRSDTVALRDLSTGSAVPGRADYFMPARRVEFSPGAPLKPATSYRVEMSAITDASGNAPSPAVAWVFTTAP